MWEIAARHYRRALDRNPTNSPIWVQYGHALKESRRLSDAEAAYRTALSYKSNVADTHLQLGHVLKLQGKMEAARDAYLRAVILDPSLPSPKEELIALGWERLLDEVKLQLHGATAQAEDNDNFLKFELDLPVITGNRLIHKHRQGLQIEGWALAKDGVASIDVAVDDRHCGTAKYGLRREDVAAAWPDWQDSLFCGYALTVPARSFPIGAHSIQVDLRSRGGRTKTLKFELFVEDEDPTDRRSAWATRRRMPRAEVELDNAILSGMGWRPRFGLALFLASANAESSLETTLRSLRAQVYNRWFCLVVCGDDEVRTRASNIVREQFADIADRIHIAPPEDRSLVASFREHDNGRSDFIGVLAAGDILGCDALIELALWTGLHRDTEFVYADERCRNPVDGKTQTFLKPDWSPDLLLATNYIGRFWCASSELLERAGIRLAVGNVGEYDLVLRATELAGRVRHVPLILCERGGELVDSPDLGRDALRRTMERRGIAGEIREGCAAGYYKIQRQHSYNGKVSIIMPTAGNVDLIKKCVSGLFERTANQNFELIVLHNTSTKPDVFSYLDTIKHDPRVRVVDSKGSYNFSRICNLGAAEARGELLLFLNDDIEMRDPGWLDALIAQAERPEVGIVGARLLYPNGTVQHAGMFWTGRSGRHAFRYATDADPGYFGLAHTTRNVLAVTGACIMTRKNWFEKIGRFDEAHAIVNNDVDLCLRSWSHGGRVVYEPAATLIHHELASRHDLPDEYDVVGFRQKWGTLLDAGDPYYHPGLARDRDNFAFDGEPVKQIYAGNPLFAAADIRRILISKLDHIGDLVTAVPAIQRLRQHFPSAEIYLLAAPANAALAKSLVPEVKEVIEFKFFFERSGLGQREVSDAELAELHVRLVRYGFDLAVDLRKLPDARHVLQYTGARWLAGYDRKHQFPWLDIALEWDGDTARVPKRAHVSDDLLMLADAVGLAAHRAPTSHHKGRDARTTGPRLICVHPGVGTETRQWPATHFAALIDLLAARGEVDIVLVGSTDEANIANDVLSHVRNKHAVRSLVGQMSLTELRDFLGGAALFVGNNSGPQHIAAELGVPTVGIHSGVVDAHEWAPTGLHAVAMQREMTCSPCYFSLTSQCPRGLACLTELRPADVYRWCEKALAIAPAPHKEPEHAPQNDPKQIAQSELKQTSQTKAPQTLKSEPKQAAVANAPAPAPSPPSPPQNAQPAPAATKPKITESDRLAQLRLRVEASGLFSPEVYLSHHEDLRRAKADPWDHFLKHGINEGRHFTNSTVVARRLAEIDDRITAAARQYAETAERRSNSSGIPSRLAGKGLRFGIYCHSEGNFFMQEVADLFAFGLRASGVEAVLRDESGSLDEPFDIRVFVAPHEFFYLADGETWRPVAAAPNSVLYNVEQVQTQWFCRGFPMLVDAPLVLDLNFHTAEILRSAGCRTVHCMPGYLPDTPYTRPYENASEIELLKGYGFARQPYNWRQQDRLDERPIDLLFVGSNSPRRDRTLPRIQDVLDDHRFVCVYTRQNAPLTKKNHRATSTEINCALGQRSKIVLNIHRDWLGYFEWSRVVLQGLWQGALVVSDPSLPNPIFRPGEHYLEENVRHIPELVRWLLDTEEGRQKADRIRKAGHRRATTVGAMNVLLAPALDAIADLLNIRSDVRQERRA